MFDVRGKNSLFSIFLLLLDIFQAIQLLFGVDVNNCGPGVSIFFNFDKIFDVSPSSLIKHPNYILCHYIYQWKKMLCMLICIINVMTMKEEYKVKKRKEKKKNC